MTKVQRPSLGLLLTTVATAVPTFLLLRPQPDTVPPSWDDVALGSVFLVPQAVAFAVSAVDHPAARWLAVVLAGLGLTLSVLALPLYGLGMLFFLQALAATVIAYRRTLTP